MLGIVEGRITQRGRALAQDLSDDLQDCPLCWLDIERLLSKIGRDAVTYHRLQEARCNGYPDERKEAQIEGRVTRRARRLGFGVKFTGDPRGYCTRFLLPSGRYNTWGGKEDGWGIY